MTAASAATTGDPLQAPIAAAMAPVSASERITTLDILRGFALGGILLVNMSFFTMPMMYAFGAVPAPGTALDKAVHAGIIFLAQGKFYSLFSFLFGLGFSIQLARATARGASGAKFYARRIAVLLAIGLVHAFLIWSGDILILYALLGFPLILFRNRKPKALLIWALVLFLVPILLTAGLAGALHMGKAFGPKDEILKDFAKRDADMAREVERAQRAYAHGSYPEMVGQRAREVAFVYSWSFFFAPNVLAMFLLGLWAGKVEIFRNVSAHLPFTRKVQGWGLVIGVVGNGVYTWSVLTGNPGFPDAKMAIGTLAFGFGAPALSMFYASTLTLLAQDPAWARRFVPLAALGRMALTNYLLQSIICTTIFYSYGAGLFGGVGFAAGLLFWIVIYVLQMPFSLWWLRRFQMGPAEWLWRTLAYGKAQPMRA